MNADQLLSLITSRTSASLKRMQAPGPDGEELLALMRAAAAAPDHGRLHPFRIIEIPTDARDALGELFIAGVKEASEEPSEEALNRAKEKAQRGPVLLVLVGCFHPGERGIPAYEQMLSAGTALQNIVLMAHAMGYATRITSGESARTEAFHEGLGLAEHEEFLCFISIGKAEPKDAKGRQEPQELLSTWKPE